MNPKGSASSLQQSRNWSIRRRRNQEPSTTDQFFDANRAVAEAQKCRRMLFEQTGSSSTWCIVTRRRFWGVSYFFPRDEESLRQKLNQGHEVVLVFAANRRKALGSRSDYHAVDPSAADEVLCRYARHAMRHTA